MRICIIGSGATGLLLSILLKQKKNNDEVFVVEKNNKIAKKLYATGNGKCNYTNTEYNNDSYRGEDTSITDNVLDKFSYRDTISFFEELGCE